MAKEYKEVATVKDLCRYPVKSMAGERLEEIRVGWHGLNGDRRYAFTRVDNKSGFPWLTPRQFPRLVLYSAYFLNPNDVDNSQVVVRTPESRELALEAEELRSEIEDACKHKIRLMQLWRGTYDSMDISLIGQASIKAISERVGFELEMQRFRPNLLVETFEEKPHQEDRWVGELLVFGDRENSARIRINRKDLRCMVVNLDLKTAQQHPAILKAIVESRKNYLGIYGTTERPGTIRVGDIIRMVKE